MNPEKRHLFDSLRDDQRERILSGGGRIMRRRRTVRLAMRGLAGAALIAALALSVHRLATPKANSPVAVAAVPARERSLTDAELLAIFPNTPVGLIKLGNGKERLIFPRPADEKRFVAKY